MVSLLVPCSEYTCMQGCRRDRTVTVRSQKRDKMVLWYSEQRDSGIPPSWPSATAPAIPTVEGRSYELAVEPLREADVAAYLAAASSGAPLPAGLAGLVYRHSGGHPLFMRAVLDHLTQQGLLAREPNCWHLRVPIQDYANQLKRRRA